MSEETTYLTTEGLETLKAELEEMIKVQRPAVAARIGEAKGLGDISDNADYETAKNEQAFLEGRIAMLEQQLRTAKVIDTASGGVVTVGSCVALRAEDGEKLEFTIVGAFEAAPSKGRISNQSPLAKALLGHKRGDAVDVTTPAGIDRYTITKVA